MRKHLLNIMAILAVLAIAYWIYSTAKVWKATSLPGNLTRYVFYMSKEGARQGDTIACEIWMTAGNHEKMM
ncbi:unnamed protein product, partial [marine sediment metagenome]